MQPDPARVADTKGWLSRAAIDLRAAALDLAGDPPLLEDLVFHCQQAVEKALKGMLTWHDEPFGKTHNPGSARRDMSEIGLHAAAPGGSCRTADRIRMEVPLPGGARGANPRGSGARSGDRSGGS